MEKTERKELTFSTERFRNVCLRHGVEPEAIAQAMLLYAMALDGQPMRDVAEHLPFIDLAWFNGQEGWITQRDFKVGDVIRLRDIGPYDSLEIDNILADTYRIAEIVNKDDGDEDLVRIHLISSETGEPYQGFYGDRAYSYPFPLVEKVVLN